MITQGFIAERHELPQIDGSIQIELTEAGRELKRSGMVGNYWIKKSKEQQDERQRQ
jgi:DNA-binding HxlR family transcriptional regulator